MKVLNLEYNNVPVKVTKYNTQDVWFATEDINKLLDIDDSTAILYDNTTSIKIKLKSSISNKALTIINDYGINDYISQSNSDHFKLIRWVNEIVEKL